MEENLPNSDQVEVRQYLSLVAHKIQVLLRKIELLKRRVYPTPHPTGLAEIMMRILVRSFDELARLNLQIGERPHKDIVDRAWLIQRFVVRIMSRWIEAVEHAKVQTSMGGIIDAFDAICNKAQFGTCLVIYPSWNYNYSFEDVSQKLETIAQKINAEERANVFAGAYHHYVIITYPRAEEEITLGQVLIAHEVGHYIDFVQKWSTEIIDQPILYNARMSLPNEFTKEERDISLGLIQEISSCWIREIIADTIATTILGPAYVLALGEFMFANPAGVTGIFVTHPPEPLRLALMAQLTLDMQLQPIVQEPDYTNLSSKSKELFELVQETINRICNNSYKGNGNRISIIDLDIEISQKIIQWIYTQLILIVQDVVTYAKTKSFEIFKEAWTCSPKDIVHALALYENLEYGFTPTKLPPSFSGATGSFAAAMNSGWFYLLDHKTKGGYSFFGDDPQYQQRSEKISAEYISVHQLVAKAIESINFERNYLHQKGL